MASRANLGHKKARNRRHLRPVGEVVELPSLTMNACHLDVLQDDTRFKVLDAGRGFGKTLIVLAEIFKHLQTPYTDKYGNPHKHRIWYIAPTYKQGKEIFWERLKTFFEGMIAHKDETSLTIELTSGATISIKGSDKPDSLRGPYLTLAIFDEFAFHKPGYWTRIIRPMLGKVRPYGGACFYSTPDGHNEFYTLFMRGQSRQKPAWKSWEFTSLEGGFMDEAEIEEAKLEMTTEEWLQEYFGKFIAQSGRVYYAFDRHLHCQQVKHVPGLDVHWFWDFNAYPSTHSGLAHVHKGKAYVFDEICTGNTPDIVAEFMKRYPPALFKERNKIVLYGDAFGDKSTTGISDYLMIQTMLVQAGYPEPELKVGSMNPWEKDRTNSVNVKLKNAAGHVGVYINPDTCPKLVNDLEQVKRNDRGKIDKTTDPRITHISDAFGYFIFTLWPVLSPQRKVLESRPRAVVNEATGYWV